MISFAMRSQNVIYHSLQGDRTVSHTKEHYQGFEKVMVHIWGCLLLITELNTDIVKASAYIQLDKVLDTLEFCNELGDQW